MAGSYTSDAFNFHTEAETPEPTTKTINWNKVAETVSVNQQKPVDSDNRGFPVYYDGTGDIIAMTDSDFIDTFILPAIDTMAGTSLVQGDAGGTFFIHTSTSSSTGTAVSTSPIFTDTRANAAAYSASSIPEAQDQPTTITNYYLHKVNSPSEGSFKKPCFINSSGNIDTYSKSEFQKQLSRCVLWATRALTGYKLRYYLTTSGASGSTKGTLLNNTRLSGTDGSYQTRFVNSNDYRTQEFPYGSSQTISTYALKIRKT
jgi:hypothetical protein